MKINTYDDNSGILDLFLLLNATNSKYVKILANRNVNNFDQFPIEKKCMAIANDQNDLDDE